MYTHNNPFYFKDPSGLWSFSSIFRTICKIFAIYQGMHTGVVQDEVTLFHSSFDGSCRESYVGPNGNPSVGKIGFINRINTSNQEWHEAAGHLSKVAGGSSIGGVYSESHGILDVLECDFLFWLSDLKSVTELRKELIDFHESAAPGQKYLLFAHSRGAIVAYVALKELPQEVRERVIVRAYAPAKYIPDDFGCSVVNYKTDRDFVPWFQNLYNFFSNEKYTIQTMHSDALFDHSFRSPTFEASIEQNINKFLNGSWNDE